MHCEIFTSHSAKETKKIAANLARQLKPPCVIALEGDLGAGKTTFVQGFVKALSGGTKERVQSPTFALMRTYQTNPPVHHLDLYRITNRATFEDLGLEEAVYDPNALVLIEWPQNQPLPAKHILVRLKHLTGDSRTIEIIDQQPPHQI